MNLAEMILADEEITKLKEQYYKKFGKNAPPYCLWEDSGIEDYKDKLRKLVGGDRSSED